MIVFSVMLEVSLKFALRSSKPKCAIFYVTYYQCEGAGGKIRIPNLYILPPIEIPHIGIFIFVLLPP